MPRIDETRFQVYREGDIEPQTRFKGSAKRVKANFNSDLIRVAADKVQNLEIASRNSSSEENYLSNGKRVERLLRSVEKNRSTTELVEVVRSRNLRASVENSHSRSAIRVNE